MLSIADNVKRAREVIAAAAQARGRDPAEIRLVAASKTKTAADIREAITAGVDALGENRQQEMSAKLSEGAYEGAPLHFIGHLQSNKVKQVAGVCDLIESVSSAELLRLIGSRAVALGIMQEILLECNIGGEESKSGADPEELPRLLDIAAETPGILVRGLMAIPPISGGEGESRRYFARMSELFVDISAEKYDNVRMDFLSMGMSANYRDAILEGANMVRLGTAIFGAR